MPEQEPSIYFDLYNGSLIVGEDAYVAAYEAMERGGHPSVVEPLFELIAGESKLPSFATTKVGKYEKWTNNDFITYGQWLLSLLQSNGDGRLTAKKIDRAATLGLGPSTHAISEEWRFGKVTTFQEAIGQELIREVNRFKSASIDIVQYIRKVGEEVGTRPTAAVISARAANSNGPGYDAITNLMPLSETYELAGYIFPRNWNDRQYLEWGYNFFLANGRLPNGRDFDRLSKEDLGPSSTGVEDKFGPPLSNYLIRLTEYLQQREELLVADVNRGFKNGLPHELYDPHDSPAETVRKTARYKVVDQLFENTPKMTKVAMSQWDISGQTFINYLHSRNTRLEDWMMDAAARRTLFYSEIFPDGALIKELGLPVLGKSHFELKKVDESQRELLVRLKKNNLPPDDLDFTDSDQELLDTLMGGDYLKEVAVAYGYAPSGETFNKKHYYPLLKKMRAKNRTHLIRQCVIANIIKPAKPNQQEISPVLTLKQREMLELLSLGANRAELALTLGIARATINGKLNSIYKTLGVTRGWQAILAGYKTGNLHIPSRYDPGSYLPEV